MMDIAHPGFLMLSQRIHGETPNSHLGRNFKSSGVHSLSLAWKRLLHRRPALDVMPSGLEEYHREFGHLFGPLGELLTGHTAINWYCCGLPLPKFHDQWERLAGQHPGPVRLCRLPVLFGSTKHAYLKCPECDEQRLRQYAFTYGHRREGVDLASVCPEHGLLYRPEAEQLLLFEQHCKTDPTPHQLKMGRELAIRQEDCLENPAETSKYHKDRVAVALENARWITETGRIHLQPLKDDFTKFFCGAFPDARLGLLCQSEDHIENALRALLRPDRAVYPVWCVLFNWFAENCDCPKVAKPKAAPAPAEYKEEPSVEELRVALAKHKSLQRAADALNMTRSRVETLCRLHDLPVKWREKKVDAHIRAEIKKALKRRIKPDSVCQLFRISQSTLYKLLRTWPDILSRRHRNQSLHLKKCKRAWLGLLRAHPGKAETDLRRLNPAAWTVLHRRAKDWLGRNAPSPVPQKPRKKKPYSPELLQTLNLSLRKVADACAMDGRKPIRKSAYRIRTSIGINEYAFETVERLGLVKKHEEERSTFIGRRIAHAVRLGTPRMPKLWPLAKGAGLREKTVRDYLQKQTKEQGVDVVTGFKTLSFGQTSHRRG